MYIIENITIVDLFCVDLASTSHVRKSISRISHVMANQLSINSDLTCVQYAYEVCSVRCSVSVDKRPNKILICKLKVRVRAIKIKAGVVKGTQRFMQMII
jgi:hypothetical protein